VRYELAHEYLTHEIWQWMSAAEISRREAQELIAADLRAWTTFDSLRLGVDRLERYYEHARNLKIDENVGTLLLLSSVRHSRPHAVWVEAISKLHQTVQTRIAWSLLRFIATRSDDQRFEAAEAMAALDSDVVLSALSAADREIRHAALYMVGGLGLSSAQPILIEALKNADDGRSAELACLALGEIGGQGATEALIRQASSASVKIAAAAVRGLGSCIQKSAFPYLMTALWGQQSELIRAAQLGIAAAASAELSTYLADNIESTSDVNGRPISLSSRTRLSRILEGFDHARAGDKRLLAPFRQLIRADTISVDQFNTPWLVDGLRQIKDANSVSEADTLKNFKGKLRSADDVVAALEEYRIDSVATALAEGGAKSLPILRGLSSHDSNQVRLTILMALGDYADIRSDSSWRTYIRPSLLVRGLQDDDPGIRYYACLAVKNLKLIECVPFLRPLARDDVRGSWYTPSVGKRVSDAAHAALDSLRPESKVWRKDWQLDARPL
jgi:HEAT repeat protein